MGMLWMDGCDGMNSNAMLTDAGYVNITGTPVPAVTLGRFGNGRIAYASNALGRAITPGSDTVIAHGAINFSTLSASMGTFFSIRESGTANIIFELQVDSTGALRILNAAGATIATSSAGILASGSVWYWLAIKLTRGASGSAIVKVDGIEIFNVTAQDFTDGGAAISHVVYGGGGGHFGSWDDIVILDSTGSAPLNDFLPDSKIEPLVPNGDGGVVDWTRNTGSNDWEAVDDAANAVNDGDTTYVASSTPGQEGRYNYGALSSTPSTIYGVQIKGVMKKDDAGARSARQVINSGGAKAIGAIRALTTSYVHYYDFFEFDPASSPPVAWTSSAVNALQAGAEVVA